jgi:hypothetical protein
MTLSIKEFDPLADVLVQNDCRYQAISLIEGF